MYVLILKEINVFVSDYLTGHPVMLYVSLNEYVYL